MRVEGVYITDLAERVGTPFYCYSAAAVAVAVHIGSQVTDLEPLAADAGAGNDDRVGEA